MKVSHAEWATPIEMVPTYKHDGTIRLCGSYKVTVSKELSIYQYSHLCPKDLMTALTGGRKFSKLHLSAAYQQMPLKEESHQICHHQHSPGTVPLYTTAFQNSICLCHFSTTIENYPFVWLEMPQALGLVQFCLRFYICQMVQSTPALMPLEPSKQQSATTLR